MRWFEAVLVVVVGALLISGGSASDPRTPRGLPGLPAPFLGTAVVGGGGRTAAVDASGDVVDLRAPGRGGRALAAVSAKRQVAGTVSADDAIVAWARLRDGTTPPFWRADSVRQRYLPGANVLRTVARFGREKAVVVRRTGGPGAVRARPRRPAQARTLGGRAAPFVPAMVLRP